MYPAAMPVKPLAIKLTCGRSGTDVRLTLAPPHHGDLAAAKDQVLARIGEPYSKRLTPLLESTFKPFTLTTLSSSSTTRLE